MNMVIYSNRNDVQRVQGRASGTKGQDKECSDASESSGHPASQKLASARRPNIDLVRSSQQYASHCASSM